jgi:hypothetical protein
MPFIIFTDVSSIFMCRAMLREKRQDLFWSFFPNVLVLYRINMFVSRSTLISVLKDSDDGVLYLKETHFWTLSIVYFLKTQRFGNWICSRLQVK